MARTFAFLLIFFIAGTTFGQFEQISINQGYTDQVFYSLSEGSVNIVDNEIWDIAFTTQGVQDAGIFINEAAALGGQAQIELYLTKESSFDDPIVVDTADWIRLYNPEKDWLNGAFNEPRDPSDVFDYGWGKYNSAINTVEGTSVYAIKLRDGSWKKIFVEGLFFDWVFKYADLNNDNEQTAVVSKVDHVGKVLAYYSFAEADVVDIEPESWDLLFTRYSTYTDDGNGNFRDYVVSGALSGLNVTVAQMDNVNPDMVSHTQLSSSDYKTELDAIGFDWKEVDFNTSIFSIVEDRVYFVKEAGGTVCKVQFIDFEGASTGVITIKKECSIIASNENEIEGLKSISVFPNPTSDRVEMITDFEEDVNGEIVLIDINGKVVQRHDINFTSGLGQTIIPVDVVSGNYQLMIRTKAAVKTMPLIVVKN